MIEIKQPATREEYKSYYDLRFKVLREPWGQPRGTEKDDYEPLSQHFMAVEDKTGEVLGVVKMFEKTPGVCWVSHLAIAPGFQNKGVGKLLMTHLEELAKQQGFKTMGCMSRLNTTGYFEKMGYKVAGLPTNYFGTTQVVWMDKLL
jgi:N-acetylglutamate synthase-like GNAT family acetyltransferase